MLDLSFLSPWCKQWQCSLDSNFYDWRLLIKNWFQSQHRTFDFCFASCVQHCTDSKLIQNRLKIVSKLIDGKICSQLTLIRNWFKTQKSTLDKSSFNVYLVKNFKIHLSQSSRDVQLGEWMKLSLTLKLSDHLWISNTNGRLENRFNKQKYNFELIFLIFYTLLPCVGL